MSATRRPRNVHPALQELVCEGGLFDVEPCEMDLNVGRRCLVRRHKTDGACDDYHVPGFWSYGHHKKGNWKKAVPPYVVDGIETFTITCVQKNYCGDLVYRVVGDHDVHQFGRCAAPADIVFVEE